MAIEGDIQRLDRRIDELGRERVRDVERIAAVEQQSASHAAELGKVGELEKGMVKLNTQFGLFRDGVREDLAEIRDGVATLTTNFENDRKERAEKEEQERERREKERKDRQQARKERVDTTWNRLLLAIGAIAVILGALITAYLGVH